MDLRIKFKPRKYTVKAQSLNYAYYQILDKLPALSCFTYGSRSNGSQFSGRYNNRNEMLYVYNVESFKRGKYRKNKHYDVYVYSIPMQLLDIVKMEVHQHHRNFTIKML
jgi:hypothetical protein